MGRNIIVILCAIFTALVIVLSGCLPSTGKTMKTGEKVKPPHGYIDMQNRS